MTSYYGSDQRMLVDPRPIPYRPGLIAKAVRIGIIAALAFHAGRFWIPSLRANEVVIIKGIEIFFWFVVVITIVSGITYLPFMTKKKGTED